MSPLNQQNDIDKDNELADFTDRLLLGNQDPPASSTDAELLHLEETILRLKQTFPSETPNEARSKQMLARLNARLKREEQAMKPSFWKELFNLQANPQIGMIAAFVAVLVLVVLVTPTQNLGGAAISGSASTSSGGTFALIAVLLLVIVAIFWQARKK